MGDSDDSLRAADDDRQAVANRLRTALDEGRLDATEYDERLRATYAAVTLGDLAPITRDLPTPPNSTKQVVGEGQRPQRSKLVKEFRDWAGTACVLVGIWAVISFVSGGLTFFWPGIPLGIWGVIILAGALFGSGGDRNSGQRDRRRGLEG